MLLCVGKSKRLYNLLEPAWKSGGEGSIYKIQGRPNQLAKIFAKDKMTFSQKRKLESMFQTKVSRSVKKITTWPIDLLYQNNQLVGYVMKNVKNTERLCDINDPSYKKLTAKDKIKIAIRLCEAIEAIHAEGHVIGDMNPRNILINPKKRKVVLIDTDSYHIIDSKKKYIYRCNVGTPEYLAPELMKRMSHGERLDTLPLPTFTQQTDLFALAIHVFSLLMDGCHPFTCRLTDSAPDSTPCPQKKDNILNGFSPYFSFQKHLGIPTFSPPIKRLNKKLYRIFSMTFINGHTTPTLRPGVATWKSALRSAYKKQRSIFHKLLEKLLILFFALMVATKMFPDTIDIPIMHEIWEDIDNVTEDILDSWSFEDWIDDITDFFDDVLQDVIDWGENFSLLHMSSSDSFTDSFSTSAHETTVPTTDLLYHFYQEGIIYPDSHLRYLTRTEVELLNGYSDEYSYAKLLRHIVNEIYARKGYVFQKVEWSTFYQQYEWYNQLEKHTLAELSFNDYEFQNIELILAIERELGY